MEHAAIGVEGIPARHQVNSYTEQDRPLVEEALHSYFKGDEEESDKNE